jgi:chemotaxis protein MotB
MIEVQGLPTRAKIKNAAHIPPEEASGNPSPEPHDRDRRDAVRIAKDRSFAMAAASLRQALQELPDLSEISKNIMMEETKEGLNIELVDQDGRSMFPEGSREPFERTRRALAKLAGPLRAVPYRISITGHSSASKTPSRPGYGPWELSTDRAATVRRILEGEGVPAANFFAVSGKADTQPLFPDDPFIAANRRVTITLMREEPPIAVDFKP